MASEVLSFLKLVAQLKQGRPSAEQFLLDHGKAYEPNAQTFSEPRQRQGMCFMNATHEALGTGRLYVEGYVVVFGLPIEHAWTVDAAGQIYDATLLPGDRIGGYYGVAFNSDYLLKTARRNGYYGLLGLKSKSRKELITGAEKEFA